DPTYRDWFIAVDGDPDLSQVVRPRALPLLTPFQTAAGEKKVWTTFSADQVDVNVHDPDVLLELIDVLLFYVGLGARFIRLDAIAYLWKEIGTSCIHLPQTHHAIQLMRAVLDEVAPDVMLITETNVPHRGYVSYKHNPDGTKSPYELNVNYFDALSDPAADEPEETQIRRFLAAHAIMLAMPGMPGIYFHSLFGSRGDHAGAETSGIPRRINRQKFTRAELERELADPASRRARVLFELKALLR